jgi:SulP family sulfate permease
MNDFFGLGITDVPADFLHKWWCYIQHTGDINWWSFGIALMSLLIIIFTPKISSKVPGSLVAIIVATLAVWLLDEFTAIEGVKSISTIGDLYTLPQGMPAPTLPELSLKEGETILGVVQSLFPAAFTIAILGAIESLLSATVADGVIGDHHDSNQELVGQGIANIICPIFGGIPATGAIARTMTNINNGGRTPIAGIIHAIVLLLIFLLLMPLAKYIPMACLAGVLVIVSYNMSGWRTFRELLRNPKSDVTVLFITFILTVIFDLTIAIEFGLVLACLLFIRRVMETTQVNIFKDEIIPTDTDGTIFNNEHFTIPEQTEVYEIDGPFFFGIATQFEEVIMQTQEQPKVRILRMRKVPFIDSSGLHNLKNLCDMCHKDGVHIILSGVNPKVHEVLKKNGFYNILGQENICDNIQIALDTARKYVQQHPER